MYRQTPKQIYLIENTNNKNGKKGNNCPKAIGTFLNSNFVRL